MTTTDRGWLSGGLVLAAGLLLSCCGNPDSNDPGAGASDEPLVGEAHSAFRAMAEAFSAGDTETLQDLSSGPAEAFFAHVDLARRAGGVPAEDVFPNVEAGSGDASVLDDSSVRFAGPVTWGDPEGPPPRVLTDFVFVEDGDTWRLADFTRSGVPIGQWVTGPPDEGPVGDGAVTARVLGVFVDVGCRDGMDPDCPEEYDDGLAIDFEITNDTAADLEPMELTLPDGSRAAAWLESRSGDPEPLRGANLQGLPPGETSPVSALVGGVKSLGDGGVLHIAVRSADGQEYPLHLPVPAYPAKW